MAEVTEVALDRLPVERLVGQLIVGGFVGAEMPRSFRAELAAGRRAGAILFKRNLGELDDVLALTGAIGAAAPAELPPFVAVDQEGGRVARLGAPFLRLPPARALGDEDDVELTQAAAAQLGRELRAAGFNLDFAPVMDVDTNPDNPVIGDRSYGRDARTVMKHGVAFVRGLQSAGVLACAKHFPGHGDTLLDSHLALPTVDHDEERLRRVELPPFRAASGAGVASMMSAHVVYPALEPGVPATLSRAICQRLLRDEVGFEGALFSDDLEMAAVARHHRLEEAAIEAVWAGCDVLLICKDEDAQARAHQALAQRAGGDSAFRGRCLEAARRSLALRRLSPPRVAADARRVLGSAPELAARLTALAERGA
jgi:beta-N-acetylhexosaminidase